MLRSALLAILVVIVCLALYLTLWPVPIHPVAWDPPVAPELTGPYAVNDDLVASRRLVEGPGPGPEDVAFDDAGYLYTGLANGQILRTPVSGGRSEVYANTGGRPYGMRFDAAGNLIVADGLRGLLRVTADQKVETLATEAGGVPLNFADDLDIAPDGTIYLSDASTKFGVEAWELDMIEHSGNGRLVAYNPASKTAWVVLQGLQFANGVTVAPDGSYVLIAETWAYRIRRVWLTGPKAGTDEPFSENLPGFPDNINFSSRGTIWVALPGIRAAHVDARAQSPFMRKLFFRLPAFMQAATTRYGLVVELGADGKPLRSLHDRGGLIANVTSVMERGNELFLGSHVEPSIAVVQVAAGR